MRCVFQHLLMEKKQSVVDPTMLLSIEYKYDGERTLRSSSGRSQGREVKAAKC